VLGYVLGFALVLTALSPVIFTDAFADSFNVDFDKQFYGLGDSLTVSGEILDGTMPVIAMSIYDPDGKILSANNLEITSEKIFSKTISLDSPFYDKFGEYLIKFDYASESQSHPFVIEDDFYESEIFADEIIIPEIILLYTEEKQYYDKDVVEITGLVSSIDSPTVLIGIYDPFGMPAGFYFGTIDSNLEFNTSFLVKDGVNFRTDGTYSVKAHYAESEAVSFFEYSKVPQIIEEDFFTYETEESVIEDEEIIEPIDKVTENEDTSEEQIDNSQNESEPINNSPIITTETMPNENVEIKNIVEEIPVEKTNVVENKVNTTKEKPQVEKTKKENNLTVEDIELGKILNQIKLKCDTSTYTDTIFYYDGMGPALYRLCKFDSSLNFFNESLIQNPNDLEILVNKGSTLGKLGHFIEAIAYYDQAIKIDPSFLPAKNNKANALANLGNFNDAVFLYDEILKENPNYLTARNNLEIVLSSNLDLQEKSTKPHIEKITQLEPDIIVKPTLVNSEKQKPVNFFDEVGIAFSSLGSLFGFLN